MNLDQLSYKQLKTFLSVYKHGQGNLAAAELGLTSSMVSRTVGTLREVFCDPLFIRKPNGLVPTEKANEIVGLALNLVEQYQLLERQYSVFDPRDASGRFVIRAYDEFIFATHRVINKYIAPAAPDLRFDIGVLSYDCAQELTVGGVDFAVVYEGFDDHRLNSQMFSATGDIYILGRKGHPIFSQPMTLENLAQYPLLEIDNYKDLSCPLLVDLSREQGLSMQVAGYTESVATAVQLLSGSDAVTLSCNQFTRRFVGMVPTLDVVRLEDEMIDRIKEIRSAVRPVGNYLVYGNFNNSPAFNWVKAKLLYGLGEEWRAAVTA